MAKKKTTTTKRTTKRDPVIAAAQRKAIAKRRVGENAKCSECDERRPLALVRKEQSVMCIEDIRKKKGHTPLDRHHPAGQNNHAVTVQIPANDHRAVLNDKQHNWPQETLQNPRRSFVRRAAACIRGFVDMLHYMINKFLGWIPEMLETLDDFLIQTFKSDYWWKGTPLEKFA